MKKVSFVIRTLNEVDSLPKTIRLINNLNGDFDKEIIVVDSGSTDGTIDAAIKEKNVIIVTIPQSEWSWGYSLNKGIESASGCYIVIISAHCYITSNDFLSNAIGLLESNHNTAAVYGKQKPIYGVDPFEEWELYSWYPDLDCYVMDDYTKLIGVSNACCVLKKSVWVSVKFDEKAQSMEDGIWAISVIKSGWNVIYSAKISVFHSHQFEPKYIYRKWFSRTLQGLQFADELFNDSLIYNFKRLFKRLFLNVFFILKEKKELQKMCLFFRNHDKVRKPDILAFLSLKYLAIKNAHETFFSGGNRNYWDVDIDDNLIASLNEIKNKL